MRKLIIHNLGPIDDCELTYKLFTILTGEQASGKSTIAKALYYFRTVKDDMLEAVSSIVLDNGKYVRINFVSSGQQDALWITNLLFYYLVTNRPTMFIIEEPESHLFPPSQKYITELISLVCNQGHSVLVMTHSPYILG